VPISKQRWTSVPTQQRFPEVLVAGNTKSETGAHFDLNISICCNNFQDNKLIVQFLESQGLHSLVNLTCVMLHDDHSLWFVCSFNIHVFCERVLIYDLSCKYLHSATVYMLAASLCVVHGCQKCSCHEIYGK
jgi:hypothetical protein